MTAIVRRSRAIEVNDNEGRTLAGDFVAASYPDPRASRVIEDRGWRGRFMKHSAHDARASRRVDAAGASRQTR